MAVNLINGSKDIRDQYITNTEVLEKVKHLSLLPDNEHMTLRQVSDYYEIDIEVIRKTIQRHRAELISDGMIKLSGKKLEEFKSNLPFNVPELHKVPSTQLLNRRSVLRMGMLLKNSKVAEKVRTYLLEAENLITAEQKQLIFQGSWTDEIDQFILNQVSEDEKAGIRLNDTIRNLSKKLNTTVHQLKNYWYVGGQGKQPLRNRIDMKLIPYDSVSVCKTQQQRRENGFNDLFQFGDEQTKEKILVKQTEKINELHTEFSKLKEMQRMTLEHLNEMQEAFNKNVEYQKHLQQDNRELKGMIMKLYQFIQSDNLNFPFDVQEDLLETVKTQELENIDFQEDMNELIKKAGISVLLGQFIK